MPQTGKDPEVEKGDQRSLTTFFSLRDVGYLVITGIMVASAFFTFENRVTILEHSNQVSNAVIEEIKENDERILQLDAEINVKLADIIAKENRLILDVERIRQRLHTLEIKGGAK